jgi:hypothetical protein
MYLAGFNLSLMLGHKQLLISIFGNVSIPFDTCYYTIIVS